MNSLPQLLLAGLLGSVLLMCLVFVLARRLDNYGIVDIAWSWGFTPLAIGYGLLATGNQQRDLVLAVCVSAWSLRLGAHLYRRVMGHHPAEDGRYRQLREDWGDRTTSMMFGFYQLQALVLCVLTLPYVLIALNPSPELVPLEWAGVAVMIFAVGGEALSDLQLNRFKADPANRGLTCEFGLWRYSRHPNYFFEWLVWVGVFLFALPAPNGWLAVVSPALIYYFLTKKTGIPATEEQALRTKGDAYRRYQQTTSAFVPWFRKEIS